MDQASTLFLAISIMIIMAGMGLGLTLQDFKRVAENPKPVLIGLFNQIIILPLVGFGLCVLFKPEPFIAIGLMMLVACPGGTSSNIIAFLAKGDLPLSISLTAINSLITIFTIPLIINFSFGYFENEMGSVEPPALDIFKSLIAVIAVPLTIGMLIKKKVPGFADKMEAPVRNASAILLAIVIVVILVNEFDLFIANIGATLGILVSLSTITMGLGFLTSKWLNLTAKQALTIAIESGIQNGTLTISLAVITIANSDLAIVAAIYGPIMYIMAILPVLAGIKNAKK
ncbi:MAG: bile acid:sodium symporter family protein [Flavobacteriaceae bacterium]|jgi:bile acid:Na+ symporter, BASS family|nr:bile acid:sodium symporter family protein [Flavobacteriaceae bacterium]MDO7591028.1 bile acid:sodium symporter family protein [Flavobacteriaceae bacterium]MDO7599711.1 bile acid:sodium symporter family protein [Flavobacteriaceae bacterium]